MKKLLNILLGWWFWITNRNNKLAKERLAICAECEFRKGFVCGICFCTLNTKARIIEEMCPANKWIKIKASKDY